MSPEGTVHEPQSAATVETLADRDEVAPKSSPDLDAPLQPGVCVDRYVILHLVGGGGMGLVYAAYDPELDRKVAIKLLRRRPRKNKRAEEDDRTRMLREAQALARLQHPHVVAVHDVGVFEGRVFVAMDFVEGETLRQFVQSRTRAWREIVAAYVQAGHGLAAAHEAELVHRDFKPDNAIMAVDGRVRVLDFGLARQTAPSEQSRRMPFESEAEIAIVEQHSDPHSVFQAKLTKHAALPGTPAYMAPEQHMGEPADERSDQFSFCVSLWEALYGVHPFRGDSAAAIAFAILEGNLREPPRSGVPTWLRKVVTRGLQVDASRRYRSMHELLVALEHDPHRRRRRAAIAGVGVATLVAGGWWYGSSASRRETPCTTAASRMAEVWNDERRQAVRASFERTDRSYALRTATAVASIVDEYANAWTAMHTDACRATHVRQEQSELVLDARMACLQRTRQDLDALLARLQRADGDIVDVAIEAATELPDLAVCADLETLSRRGRRVEDPAQRGERAAIAEALAEVQAAARLGQLKAVVAQARAVVERARAVDDPPLLTEALHTLGSALEESGEYREAYEILLEAEIEAERIEEPRVLASIRATLIHASGERMGEPNEGYLWGRLARAAAHDAGNPASLMATIENNLAHVYATDGQPELELEHRLAALRLAASVEHPSELELASFEASLATSLADAGRPTEAMELAARALDRWRRALGAEHPNTAYGHATSAYVLDGQGRSAEALAEHERAIAILEAALGPESLAVAEMRSNAAVSAVDLGDLDRAAREFELVLRIKQRVFGQDHIEVAQAWRNLSGLQRMRGEHEAALRSARTAVAITERHRPPDHPDVASALSSLANVLEDMGAFAEVVPLRERTLEIERQRYGPMHPELVIDTANLAYSAVRAGLYDRALVAAERAFETARTFDVKKDVRAFAWIVLARVLAERRRDEARIAALTEEALRLVEGLPAPAERRLAGEIAARMGWQNPPSAGAAAPNR